MPASTHSQGEEQMQVFGRRKSGAHCAVCVMRLHSSDTSVAGCSAPLLPAAPADPAAAGGGRVRGATARRARSGGAPSARLMSTPRPDDSSSPQP